MKVSFETILLIAAIHMSTDMDIIEIQNIINKGFGASIKYEGDGIFEASKEDVKKIINNIEDQYVDFLYKELSTGYNDLYKLKKGV